MNSDAVAFLESSFLAPLLEREGVTDISYNGNDLYFATNSRGREKSALSLTSLEAGAFLRQIANLCERQFSFSSPIMDVSFGRYRLNAVNLSLARYQNEKTYTFSLRLASGRSRLEDNKTFFGGESEGILRGLLEKGESIVIGGRTSSGKTELEKYLISRMGKNRRVIVIDNIEELDMMKNEEIDLTTWLVNEKLEDADFSSLIKNALRNNPDYIVVAEARGAEMLDAIVSAMSGHALLTTIHAQDLEAMPERMARLAMLGNERLYKEELMDDIAHHIRYYVYLEKKENTDGSISRYVDAIGYLDEKSAKMEKIYRREQ